MTSRVPARVLYHLSYEGIIIIIITIVVFFWDATIIIITAYIILACLFAFGFWNFKT